LRQQRVRGDEYTAFVDEFVDAAEILYPKCCIQWEDFANINAVPILARYRDKICTFNDDIQGTAGIALAGIFGAPCASLDRSSPTSAFCSSGPGRPRPESPS
jgi:malate dehydrogenase (oxaloacetate-decarboxylating)(NADP+)